MSNWMHSLMQRVTKSVAPQRPSRRRRLEPFGSRLWLESLENRSTPATLDVISGVLTYAAAAGEANVATLMDQGTQVRLNDTGATISLGAAATAAGYTLLDSHTAVGPNAGLSAITLDLGDAADVANIRSTLHATSVLTGDGNDTVNVNSNASLTGNLAGIAAELTIDAGAGVNALNVSDFSASAGNSAVNVSATQILGLAGPSDASAINYAATGGTFGLIRILGSNSPNVSESVTVNNPGGPIRLDANAGADTANIQNISAAASINMGAGSDAINVSSDAPANLGTLNGIQATLTLDAGTGANAVEISDFGQTALPNDAIGVTPTQITGLAGMSNASIINYRASGGTFSELTLDGSNTLADTFNVTGNTPATLNGNGGDDAFNLAAEGAAAKTISGAAGSDTLSYAGYTSAVSVALAGSADDGFTSTAATGLTGFSGIDDLVGGANLADILTGENVASTWDIDDSPTYNDGAHTLSFGDFETLNGGTAADAFNLTNSEPGVPLTLNGNDGDDAFSAIAWDNLQGDVAINGGAGVNTLAVDDSANTDSAFYTVAAPDLQREAGAVLAYSDMATITLEVGAGASNAIDVESTPAGASVSVIGGPGQNDFQISQVVNNLDALLGDLILAAGSPADTLTVNDQLNLLDTAYTISDTAVTRTEAAAVTLLNSFDQIVVFGGQGVNTFAVDPSATAAITVIDGGAGTGVLNYHMNGGPTPLDDGFSITDPAAAVLPVFYSGIATVNNV